MDANRKSIASLRVIEFEVFVGSSPREKEALVPTNPSSSELVVCKSLHNPVMNKVTGFFSIRF